MTLLKQSYWGHNGKYQSMCNCLNSMVPRTGKSTNEHVEIFRKLAKVYYDYYNNGSINYDVFMNEGNEYFNWDGLLQFNTALPVKSRLDETLDRECGDCDGWGEVDCRYCDSNGKIRCDDCVGYGTDDDENDCEGCAGKGEVDCDDCEGCGSVSCVCENGNLSDPLNEIGFKEILENFADDVILHCYNNLNLGV